MASAWGRAWGAAWGNAWGTVAAPVTQAFGGWVPTRSKRKRYVIKADDELQIFDSTTDNQQTLVEAVKILQIKKLIRPALVDELLIEKRLDRLIAEYRAKQDEQDIEDLLLLS